MLALLLVAILLDDGPRGAAPDPASPTDASAQAAPTAALPTVSAAPTTCTYLPEGPPAQPVSLPPPEPGPEAALAMLLRTSVGDVDVVLDAEQAPCAAHSLRWLAAAGFYDDTPCHRLVDSGIFVLQCGDPTGTGSGGPGYRFAEEALEEALEEAAYPRGTVAMVNSGPGTTGSQFFLVYDDSPLPAQYTPVGTVGEPGLAVLDAVAAAGAGPVDASGATPPVTPVQLLDVEVTPLEALPSEVASD